jgi:esterase/lipase superfamily enzyme
MPLAFARAGKRLVVRAARETPSVRSNDRCVNVRFLPVLLSAFAALVLFGLGTRVASADCDAKAGPASVFFVTDREAVAGKPLFSGERGSDARRHPLVSYGVVNAPVQRASMTSCSNSAAFFRAVGKRFPNVLNRRAVLYVHGYYRTFVDAATTALTMRTALKFQGPVIFYSWPSKVTSRLSYPTDESNALWSVPHFTAFLGKLEQAFPLLPISFVSHSMGGRFSTAALQFLRYSNCVHCLGRSIFMAPDVDSGILHEEFISQGACDAKPATDPKYAAKFTLYVSNKDTALRTSQKLHGHQRAGQAGSEMILCNGVDTIDVSYLGGADRAGHSYQTYPSVLADTAAALAGIAPNAAQRKLKRASRADGSYYELRAAH